MIRIGIVGAGPNGSGNAKKLAEHPQRARVVAVADPSVEAAAKLAGAHGARPCSSLDELLDEVDAVVISTPNFLHKDQTIAAAQAGKHVWIEKPMALTVADADAMVAAVEAAGVASMVGFSVRFDGGMQALRRRVDGGELGELISLFSRRCCFFDPARFAAWRLDVARSGGVMAELIVHEIDWIVQLAGEPRTIACRKASRRHDDPRDNDHVWLTLGFDGETTGTIEGSQMAPMADYYRGVMGTRGSITTRNWGSEYWLQIGQANAVQLEKEQPFDKHAHFLDVIEGRCASVADVRYGRLITLIVERAIDSAVSGEVVELSGAGVA